MDRELVLRRRCGASLPIPARVYFQRHIRTNDLKSLPSAMADHQGLAMHINYFAFTKPPLEGG
jgi:hypothetical protein